MMNLQKNTNSYKHCEKVGMHFAIYNGIARKATGYSEI